MSFDIRMATEEDLPLLAQMNKHLFEDAGSHNPMSVDALRDRMATWLAADEWKIIVLAQEETIFGYMVYQVRPDSYEPEIAFVYVRQYFIERNWRRKGLGRAAFDALARAYFPARSKVVIDALASDPNATAFWAALGFQPYSVTMMLHRTGESPEDQ